MRSVLLILVSSAAFSSAIADEPPQKTAPNGPPTFAIDLAGFAELEAPLPYAFEGAEADARVLVFSAWSAATERSVTFLVLDPRTGKTLETFGPIHQSAAGGGERSTSEEAVAATQKRLDAYLASRRLRPASQGVDDDGKHSAPVRNLVVKADKAGVVAEMVIDGKPVSRKVKVGVPKAMKSLCEGEPIERSLAALEYDDTVPWAVATVSFTCGSEDDPLATFGVPVIIDLR